MFSEPLTLTFCWPLSTGPELTTTVVFFFLPASACDPSAPVHSSANASVPTKTRFFSIWTSPVAVRSLCPAL